MSFLPFSPKYIPPVNSLTQRKSAPSTSSFLRGLLCTRALNVSTGRRLAKSPSFFLIASSPCSGLTLAVGLLSNSGSPTAPKRTASLSMQVRNVSSGNASPNFLIAQAPTYPKVYSALWPAFSQTASTALTACSTTSGPIPSPGSFAIFRFIFYFRFSIRFNILKVALMAASVWSASSPLVLSSEPFQSQVIMVWTRASVFPPGGMPT